MHDVQHVRLALAKPAKYVSVRWRHRRRKRIVCAPAWTRARNDGVDTMLRSIAHERRSSRDGESAADREEHDVRDLMMKNLCEDDPCFLEFGLFLSASPCASPTSAEVMQGSIFSSLSKQETLRRQTLAQPPVRNNCDLEPNTTGIEQSLSSPSHLYHCSR